jgi:nitroreductase
MKPITDPMQLFRHQRAVRAFSDRPVTEEELRTVLQAAVHAPSGSNTQPWRFIVIRDQAVKDAIDEQYRQIQGARTGNVEPGPGAMAKAPVLIVPCVRIPDRTGQAGFQTGASIYPACQNLMLAARILGMGTVLTTSHRVRREEVHAILGIPAGWESAAVIPLGWPDRSYGPNHRAPLDEAICLDRFSE